MKGCTLFILLCCIGIFSQAQDTTYRAAQYHQAIVWRGFQHQWRYNHRLNCFGNYVKRFDPTHKLQAVSTHISATGTGPDSTYATSYYTLLQTSSAAFEESQVQFRLMGAFDTMHIDSAFFQVPIAPWMEGKQHYKILINGFDMHTEHISDKIREFHLSISDGAYNQRTGKLHFSVDAAMMLNCHSAECTGKKVIKYFFVLHTLIVGYNDNEAWSDTTLNAHAYKWGLCKELNNPPVLSEIKTNADPTLPFVTVGIKAISVQLNNGRHMLQWDSYVQPPVITDTLASRRASVMTGFNFKNWRRKMAGTKAAPWFSLFSFRQQGWAKIQYSLATLQFSSLDTISYESHAHEPMFWPGRDAKGYDCYFDKYDPAAIQQYNILTGKIIE